MKLRIIVEVVDDKTRKGTRRRREIEIPGRVLNVHKALCESRRDLRAFVADDVMSAAIGAVSSQQTPMESLNEALLAPSSPVQSPQLAQPSPQSGRAPAKGGGHNKLESFLGLDVIDHMDGMEAMVESHAPPQQQPPKINGMVWGAVGYGPDRGK